MQFIQYYTQERIAYITLNRPEKRNALNEQVVQELKNAFRTAEKDINAKVVVLQATGKVFCAGADLEYLQKLQNNSYEENLADSNNLKELFEIIYTHPKIIIAQIQGHAIAGGAGLATVCDFAFATPETQFGYTEVKIGFIPAIVSVFLLRKIGEGKAKELLLSGKLISAQKAYEYGLINEVIPTEELAQRVKEFALQLCQNNSATSMQITKAMIAQVQTMPIAEALTFAAQQNAQARQTDDCKKGISSFLEKKALQW